MNETFLNPTLNGKSILMGRLDISEMEFMQRVFSDPVSVLQGIRQVLKEKSDDDTKVDASFMAGLKIIFDAIQDNHYNFANQLPPRLGSALDPSVPDELKTQPIIELCKECGVTKEGMRAWLIDSFTTGTEGAPASEALLYNAEQQRQLQIVEDIYGAT